MIGQNLIERAKNAAKHAYCPYSNFPVGAIIVTKNGKVYSGCNVENAAYGSTICAERSAICKMIAAGERQIEWVVIYTPTDIASAPCGACRQVINEFGPDARVVSICDSKDEINVLLSDLLPRAFGPKNLTTKRG